MKIPNNNTWEEKFRKLICMYHKEPLIDKEIYLRNNNLYWEHKDETGKIIEYAVYDNKRKEFTLLLKVTIDSPADFVEFASTWKDYCSHEGDFKFYSHVYSWETYSHGSSITYNRDKQECLFITTLNSMCKKYAK